MDAGEAIVLLSLLFGALVLAAGFAGAWLLGRLHGERKALESRDDDHSAERLERIERLIEAMALDMERLAEAQRFTARRLRDAGAPAEKPRAPS